MDELASLIAGDQHAQIYGGNMDEESSGGFFDGWGDSLKDVATYYAKSRIDAEYNAPTRLAERQMMLQGEDGGFFEAGQPNLGNRWLVPAAIGLGALVLVVLLVRK